jgi:spore coat protein U-like protein
MPFSRLSQLFAGLLLLFAAPAAPACTVSTTAVAFGSVDPVARMPTDSAGSIVVSCPTDSAYVVAIDGGAHGTVDGRRMASGGNLLEYQLYTDANLALVWGDGTAGTVTVSGSAGPAGDVTHTVYGRIPAQPFAHVGAYADTLTVTVTF